MQFSKTLTPANASLTGFASNVTGAAFTLTATESGDSLAHQVSIRNDSATDHSGKTVTLVGTDADGAALTEVVTAPGTSATVESTSYFMTLTSATPSATIGADTFDIGWVDEFVTKTIPLDWRSGPGALRITVGGTINYDLENTLSDIQFETITWFVDDAAQDDETASLTARWEVTSKAIRVKANSYSSGATLTLEYVQSNV